jgi:hypothetical protein
MNAVTTFQQRIARAEARLLEHFRVTRRYALRCPVTIEVADDTRLSTEPHDHVVRGKIDLSDVLAIVLDADVLDAGFWDGGAPIARAELASETDDYTLSFSEVVSHRVDATIHLTGILRGGTTLETHWLPCGADLAVVGMAHADMPREFFKETTLEARAYEKDGRLKQAFFLYMTALDRLLNDAVPPNGADPLDRQRLQDKLGEMLRRAVCQTSVASEPLATRVSTVFAELIDLRNIIAHGERCVNITDVEVHRALFILLALMMIAEKSSLDLAVLTRAYRLDPRARSARSTTSIRTATIRG